MEAKRPWTPWSLSKDTGKGAVRARARGHRSSLYCIYNALVRRALDFEQQFLLSLFYSKIIYLTLHCLVTFDRNFRCGGNWFLLYHSCASKSATHWLVGDREWSTFSQWKLRPCGGFNILPTRVDGLFIFLAWRPWPHVIARAIETFDTLIFQPVYRYVPWAWTRTVDKQLIKRALMNTGNCSMARFIE